jgi:hypothetical protein
MFHNITIITQLKQINQFFFKFSYQNHSCTFPVSHRSIITLDGHKYGRITMTLHGQKFGRFTMTLAYYYLCDIDVDPKMIEFIVLVKYLVKRF